MTTEPLHDPAQDEGSVGTQLSGMEDRVRAVVPELVGLSVSVIHDWVVLTLAASSEQVAGLEAVQYLDGGPCVVAADQPAPSEASVDELLEAGTWQLYARAASSAGVRSSLLLPLLDGDRVAGGVSLYASTGDAFRDCHADVSAAVGPEAQLAVTGTDLSLVARRRDMELPERVRERGDLNVALGLMSASQSVSIPVARQRLRSAAQRAGITEDEAARAIRSTQAG